MEINLLKVKTKLLLLLLLVLVYLSPFISMHIASYLELRNVLNSNKFYFLVDVLQYLFKLIFALIIIYILKVQWRKELGFSRTTYSHFIFSVYFAILIIQTYIVYLYFWNANLHSYKEFQVLWIDSALNGSAPTIFIYILGFILLSVFTEEIIFRGIYFHFTRLRYPLWIFLLLNASFFSLYHMNILSFPYYFIMGLVFILQRIKSGSIYPVILTHLILNVLNDIFNYYIDSPIFYIIISNQYVLLSSLVMHPIIISFYLLSSKGNRKLKISYS
jgi:uncharacterized protein